jgi:DNA-binding MarR family transcriptional regulator
LAPDTAPTTDAETAERLFCFFTEVMILSHLATTAFERVMPQGLTMAQFSVLNHLCRTGDGQTQVEIARAMQVRKSTMTSTLATLAAGGLVAILPDAEDRRSKRVHVSDRGHAARSAAIGAITPELGALALALDPSDLAAGLPMLERVRHVLDARRDGEG